MSILQLASVPNIKYCTKHPQERVVGVCSSCLSQKLSSLIHTAASPPPPHVESLSQLVGSSPLTLSLLVSTSSVPPHHPPLHHQDHLLTINEEADSSTQEIVNNEGFPCKNLEELSSAMEVCTEATHTGNDLAPLSLTLQENSSICVDAPSINEERGNVNQDISLFSEVRPVIDEEIPIISLETSAKEEGISTIGQHIRAKKSAKCRRSKSLSVLRRESLNDVERAARGHELAAKSLVERTGEQGLGANKVTLRALFKIENEEKCRDRALVATAMAMHTTDIELGARDNQNVKPNENELQDSSIGDSKQTEEVTKDVRGTAHRQNSHNSHGCVPSASTFSSSVCPSVPDKLKHSVLLNSLLCRKAKDEKGTVIKGSGSFIRKPSQVHEANRHNIFIKNFNEEGFAGASEGGLIRATYIPSESRVIRTCRSKLERCIAKSSASSSQPSSPSCVSRVFDLKSERKFNLSARALAAVDVPSAILRSSAEAADISKIVGSIRTADLVHDGEDQETDRRPPVCADSDDMAAGEARPSIALVLTAEEEQRLVESIASVARKAEGPKAKGNTPVSRKRKEQAGEEEKHGEMSDSPPPPTPDMSVDMPAHNLPSPSQPPAAADTMMLTIPSSWTMDLEQAREGDTLAGTVQENATDNQPGCQNTTEKRQILECQDVTEKQPIPSYITTVEGSGGGQEAYALYGRSLSCKASSGKAGKQSSQNLPEGVWEPYSKSGKAAGIFGRSSSRHYKWPSSSRTVKIAPDQSGLLRFYLTPLRASGRTRFSSPRRPPKRRLWSFLSQGAH